MSGLPKGTLSPRIIVTSPASIASSSASTTSTSITGQPDTVEPHRKPHDSILTPGGLQVIDLEEKLVKDIANIMAGLSPPPAAGPLLPGLKKPKNQAKPTIPYNLPEWFLKNNVRAIENLGQEIPNVKLVNDTDNTKEPTSGFAVSRNDYMQLRDTTACSILKNKLGNFFSSKDVILLESDSSVDFMPAVMKYLAKDLNADSISLDLDDFEDIGVYFDYQDQLHEKGFQCNKSLAIAQTSTSYDSDEDSVLGIVTDTSMPVPLYTPPLPLGCSSRFIRDKSLAKINKNHASYNWEYRLSKKYFGYGNIKTLRKSEADKEKERSSSRALRRIFWTTLKKSKHNPLLIMIRDDANKHLTAHWFDRIWKIIQDKRKAGKPVVLFLLGSRHRQNGFGSAIQLIERNRASTYEVDRIRHTNIRRLKREILSLHPDLESYDILSPDHKWDLSKLSSVMSVLESPVFMQDEVALATSQILGQAISTKKIELKNIASILERFKPQPDLLKDIHSDSEVDSTTFSLSSDDDSSDDSDCERTLNRRRRLAAKGIATADIIIKPDSIDQDVDNEFSVVDENKRKIVDKILQFASDERELPLHKLLTSSICPTITVNFHGSSNTNVLAWTKSLAKKHQMNLIHVSATELASFPPAGRRNCMKLAFQLAKIHHPCIIYLDIEDMLPSQERRCDPSSPSSLALEDRLVQELDRSIKQPNKPVVIFGTKGSKVRSKAIEDRSMLHVTLRGPTDVQMYGLLRSLLGEGVLDSSLTMDDIMIVKEEVSLSAVELRKMCKMAALQWAIENPGVETSDMKLSLSHFNPVLDEIMLSKRLQADLANIMGIIQERETESNDSLDMDYCGDDPETCSMTSSWVEENQA